MTPLGRTLGALILLSAAVAHTASAQSAGPGRAATPRAQRTGGLPADVETVMSGGLWEQGSLEGRYRVVIRSSGFEHVISTLTIDWIVTATEDDSARVVATLTIPRSGPVAIHDPELGMVGANTVLTVTETDTHYDPPRRATRRIILGAPGVVTPSLP